MVEIGYLLDECLRQLAAQLAREVAACGDVGQLANNQIRKFWDILRVEQNAAEAYRLALHQCKKADKEIQQAKEDSSKKKQRSSKKRNQKQSSEEAKLRKAFWANVADMANANTFKTYLQQKHLAIPDNALLPLQIVFAENLYCELLYLKKKS